jgi:hypothetical protein
MKAIEIKDNKQSVWLLVNASFESQLKMATKHLGGNSDLATEILGRLLVKETNQQGRLSKAQISELILMEASGTNLVIATEEDRKTLILLCSIGSNIREAISPNCADSYQDVLSAIEKAA